MRNSIVFVLCIALFSSCHPSFVVLKSHHAKRIHGTKQIMMIPEPSDMLRFDRNQIHITSERDGFTNFAANRGFTGRGVIKKPQTGGYKKYKYKITKNPNRK